MFEKLDCSEGTFYERSGFFYVQASINGKTYKKSTGKRVNPINSTWIKRQNPRELLIKLLGLDKEIKDEKISIKEFGEKIIDASSGNRGAESQKDLIRVFNKIILPHFEYFSFDNITQVDVLNLLNKVDKKYSNDRSKRVKSILNNIFTAAYEEGLMKKNLFSMQNLKNHRFKRKPIKTNAYTVSEAKKILEHSQGWLRVFFELSFKYGLRTGECMGLKWSDFNLDIGYFRIQRSISKGVVTESSEIIHENKNHLRDIYLFPDTIELLKQYENFRPSDEWLFISKTGEPFLQGDTIRDYHFKPFLEKIGVKYKTLYAMRRTYISMMIQSEKINLEDIQDIVGHSKGSGITEKHYNLDVLSHAHLKNKAEEKAKVFNIILKMI